MRDPGVRKDRGTEIRVGILVLISLVVLVVGLFWISNARFGGPVLELNGIAPEAGQMTADAPVFLFGVNVGEVTSVRLEGLQVHVRLRIYHDAALPSDTRGLIKAAGFLGAQMVELVPGSSDRPLASGDTIRIGRDADIMSLAGELGDGASDVLSRIQQALSDETVDDVRGSAAAFAGAMQELEQLIQGERDAVGRLIEGLNRTAENLASATDGPELESTLANIDTLTSRLKTAAAGLDSTSTSLASITSRLDRGEGTLGKLLTDERLYEDLTAAVENIQTASEEIALLTRDLREQPERYLRGLKFSVF